MSSCDFTKDIWALCVEVEVDATATLGESGGDATSRTWSCVIHSFVSEWFKSEESFVTVTVAYVGASDGCLDISPERTKSFGGGRGGKLFSSPETTSAIP